MKERSLEDIEKAHAIAQIHAAEFIETLDPEKRDVLDESDLTWLKRRIVAAIFDFIE